ncbi:MAG TPA: efflux RND transporter periplasmic adaptor subunit, partial [Thermoanaerobaculia bacterium]|nr:efflux RND transporter periplasmic adaptor subunit [Thermoanaerobaculia bacterium]
QNLAYTNIYAPIDGVIVQRDVQQGQTVAASLSAPQLFMIANDLSQMQILAQVGESDIAQIKEGQPVQFTVQALPNDTFKGSVKQVRLQSTTQDNVVNYTVVISVDNSAGKLLPGMTARANFLTQSATNVLEVSNSALRFKPTDAQLAALKAAQQASGVVPSSRRPSAGRPEAGTTRRSSFGMLYYLDASGKLAVAPVHTGVTDGTTTEVSGKNLKEGMQVIAGIQTAGAQTAQTSTSASPFGGQQQKQQGGPRGGGF